MQEQTDQKSIDEHPISAVRRRILSISASVLAAGVVSPKLVFGAPYPNPLPDSAPQVDGFFFIIPGKDKADAADVNADRVFFISSSWLPYFELTDQLTKASVTDSVRIDSPGPAVVTWRKHGLGAGAQVTFSNNGPAPITTGVTYYIRHPIGDDTFQLSITPGGPKLYTTDASPADNVATVDPYTGKQRVLGKFKGKAHQENWTVLYSDNLRDSLVPNTTTQVIPLEDPRDSTYLAMHLSPSL